jgi:hypothetical protein
MAGVGRIPALLGAGVVAVVPGPNEVPDRHHRETAVELVGVAASYPALASMFVVASAVVRFVPPLLVLDPH